MKITTEVKATAKSHYQNFSKSNKNDGKTSPPVSTVIGRYDKPTKLNSPVASSAERGQYPSGEAVLTAISGELLELFLPTNRNPENPSVSDALHCRKLEKEIKKKKRRIRKSLGYPVCLN